MSGSEMEEVALDTGLIEWVGADHLHANERGLAPRRLPAHLEPQFDLFTTVASRTPSGVRLAFRTDASAVELTCYPVGSHAEGSEPQPSAVDLVIDGRHVSTETQLGGQLFTVVGDDFSNMTAKNLGPVTFRFEALPPGEKNLELWLPPAGQVTVISLKLSKGATLSSSVDVRPRWVHYGSSISQCSAANSPLRTWPVIAALRSGLSVTNLGLGGGCQVDSFMARIIRDAPADVISMKLGVNVVNMASMMRRVFIPTVHGFLDTVRDGHAHTPIVMISPIIFPCAEERCGPTDMRNGQLVAFGNADDIPRGALTVSAIREILAEIVEQRRADGDTNLHYLDGRELFDEDDLDDLPDGLHPNAAGYERIGHRFTRLVFEPGGLVPAATLRS